MPSCLRCSASPSAADHARLTPFRMPPSLLQGTSQSTRSNLSLNWPSGSRLLGFVQVAKRCSPREDVSSAGNFCAGTQVHKSGPRGKHFTRCRRRCKRFWSTSLATNNPDGVSPMGMPRCMSSNNCKVLDPGAAHKSRTRCVGDTSKSSGGSMEANSCVQSSPVFCNRMMVAWSALSVPGCICEASPRSTAPACGNSGKALASETARRVNGCQPTQALSLPVTCQGSFNDASTPSHAASLQMPCLG
mmetsp:Transcript_71577/g.232704  ORF Transcript_71577/g.232704 Transcript_71577/m.232704 type:complete len:246 (+) Transcript_71577:1608-2345(+)